MNRAAVALVLVAPPALADVAELSVRPHVEVRTGRLLRPDQAGGATAAGDAFRYGAGLTLGLGVHFAWTLTAGYTYDTTTTLRRQPLDVSVSEDLDTWSHDRHALLAGVTWTPSDALTPVVALEAGAAAQALRGAHAPAAEWGPIARGSAGFEWKFKDFWGLALTGFAEQEAGFGYGGRLALFGSGYLD
ncbi:MAG: hypothetical protein R3F60_28945 [bacterium]